MGIKLPNPRRVDELLAEIKSQPNSNQLVAKPQILKSQRTIETINTQLGDQNAFLGDQNALNKLRTECELIALKTRLINQDIRS